MAKIKHNGVWTDTGIPNAQPVKQGPLRIGKYVLRPDSTAEIPAREWEAAKKSNAVQTWLRVGIIEIVGGDDAETSVEPSAENDPEIAEKRQIIGELEALGIKKTERTSLDNLRKALEEAKPVVKLPGMP